MPRVASTCVELAGPPPETKNTALKSPSEKIVESSVQIRYRLAISGKLTWKNMRKPVAPSTRAASWMSDGIAIRPASRMMVQNGSHFQTWVTITAPRAIQRSVSQSGPVTPNRCQMMLFSIPHSPFSIQWIEM